MSDIILLGYPLELMDGNVKGVPLDWLKSVFSHLKDKLGNIKVSVMSILGTQSTGKSTLLNTIFGSRFAVSAGRCTKRVFAQLLPLKKDHCMYRLPPYIGH